ncbi:MAG: 2-C-methyl-D-erythritol 2,4-cyclodiphosphate synthase [Candidatus Coatesbacteria bacterium RBG_13_66_14]|uniref:2-C-methyl-D-erythritol 2,4-cyclodiphosphate synthase n=1 Tax=Candidatus Coatesbacteria bacterium RBG_13_66_14 TaxID=1817816 RepID=A0A1F5FFJ1_9BACT|nr:MAG: 2-C-methyl-D-erythritol 2,4-cyclodiphosphate synthase [Candidatus Coatesbacteria bacterium RBG_13_66_14]
MRVGIGFDVHRLTPGRRLVLGGVEIPFELGLDGHSDADVLVHAVMDALLGAAGEPDIGQKFPDDDPRYAGADSCALLAEVAGMLTRSGLRVVNVDVVVACERPKLAPHVPAMRERLGRILALDAARVSVKATTTEGLGCTGRGEGIAAWAAALVSNQPENGE